MREAVMGKKEVLLKATQLSHRLKYLFSKSLADQHKIVQ